MPKITVELDEVEIRCRRPDDDFEHVAWADLRAVLIETSAAGPVKTDWFWILVGKSGECVIPGDAQGADTLLESFQNLSGFENDTFIEAMSSVEARRYLCWKRAG